MAPESCRIREYSLRGYRAVALEHEQLSVIVFPEKGAEMYSIVYRPRNFDVLWKAPWGLHRPSPVAAAHGGSEASWMDAYGGGWQVIFPSGGDACEFAGGAIGFHGEASTAEWDYTCNSREPTASVRKTVSLPRTPFHLTREVAIERHSLTVSVAETVWTDAEGGFPAMWGQHPALATRLVQGARVEAPASEYISHAPELSDTARIPPGERHPWPVACGKQEIGIDLSTLPGEDDRLSEMGYLTDFSDGTLRVVNEPEKLGIKLSWDKNLFPYLWYWLEWGGLKGSPWFGRGRVAAFEPFTSMPGTGLANAVRNGTAMQFAQGERKSTELSLSVLPLTI